MPSGVAPVLPARVGVAGSVFSFPPSGLVARGKIVRLLLYLHVPFTGWH